MCQLFLLGFRGAQEREYLYSAGQQYARQPELSRPLCVSLWVCVRPPLWLFKGGWMLEMWRLRASLMPLCVCVCVSEKGCSLLLSHNGPFTAFFPLLKTPLTVSHLSVWIYCFHHFIWMIASVFLSTETHVSWISVSLKWCESELFQILISWGPNVTIHLKLIQNVKVNSWMSFQVFLESNL